jgi:hypothetical protein
VIPDDGPELPRAWTLLLFRLAVCLAALATLVQAVLAGGFLGGRFEMFTLHHDNAMVVLTATLLLAIAAGLLWRPGGGPLWPFVLGLGVLAAVTGQAFLGFQHMRNVHITLGGIVTLTLLLLVVRAWLPFYRREEHTERD